MNTESTLQTNVTSLQNNNLQTLNSDDWGTDTSIIDNEITNTTDS
jgi:hypothetical protein